jgi:signal transduction histidine kinase
MLQLSGYALETRLTATATGELFWATRDEDGVRVLLKVYGALPAAAWEQGQREQSLLEKVRSDHVFSCIDLAQHGDRVVLALRAARGASFAEYLHEHRPRELASFLRIAIQLARLVADVHAAELVLRDLAPQRLLIDPGSGRLWLVDLDGAVEQHELATSTDPRSLRDGLAYMAPECSGRMGRAADARSDLYALGAMLYELLTGKPPFDTEDIVELVNAHMTLVPVPPERAAPETPEVISRLVMTLLAKMPEERYQSAHGLHRDLVALERRLVRTGSLASVSLQGLSERAEIRMPERLYGRAQEYAHLTTALQAAAAGRPQLVLLTGPPGIGKSALVGQLSRSLGHQGYLVQGKCDQLHGDRPYQVFRLAFDELVDQLATESDARLDACRGALRTQLGAMAGALTEVVPRLDLLIGKPDAAPVLGPAGTRNRLALACRRFVDAIATAERPLVLFLDDLQWADSGSLQLIEALYEDREAYVLIIGALRSGEAEEPSLLAELLARLRAAPQRLVELRLAPLGTTELQYLLADALGCAPQQAAPLAASFARKTDGNPFLIQQFLDYLRRRELFAFDELEGWTWNLDALEQTGIPDDAVGIMTARLALLEPATRQVLVTAACIGGQFDRATLAAALGSDDDPGLRAALAALQAQGFIAATLKGHAFTHDEIQEAAYQALPAAERLERHLRVGRFWLAQLRRTSEGDPAQGSRLFGVVEQLGEALPLLTDAGERAEVARLAWQASLRAMRSAAYGAARKYARTGCALVAGDPWEANEWLRFRLHLELAESQFLLGQAESSVADLATLSELPLDEHCTLVLATRTVRMYEAVNRVEDAVRTGLAALQKNGVTLPLRPGRFDVMKQVAATRLAFLRRPEGTIHLLPDADDPLFLLRMDLLSAVSSVAYAVSQRLFFCLLQLGLRWTLRQGTTPHAPGFFATLALMRLGLGQFARARALLTPVRHLDERMHARSPVFSRMFVSYFMAELWFQDVRSLDRPMRTLSQRAIEHGLFHLGVDIEILRLLCHTQRGTPLWQLVPEIHAAQRFCAQNGVLHMATGMIYLEELFAALASDQGQPVEHARSLEDDAASDAPYMLATRRAQACFAMAVMGEWKMVYEIAERLDPLADQLLFGVPYARTFRLVHALAALNLTGGRASRRCRQIVRKSRRMLEQWAAHTSVHAKHYLALLDGAIEVSRGRLSEGMRLFSEAREHAASEGALPFQALADERRAELAVDLGLRGDALIYLAQARDAYRAWGAAAKVRELLREHPELRARTTLTAPIRALDASDLAAGKPAPGVEISFDVGSAIDLAAVLRASQAISEEVSLDRVLERVMRSVLESSGASKGVLVLFDDKEAHVDAEVRVDGGFTRHASLPLASCADLLPLSVVRYVERTGRAVIVDDATGDTKFAWDAYVTATACRSVLCMPLHDQQRLCGLLYLENRLVSGAFTAERIEVLRLLASQAASSIDKAKLYDELSGLTRDLENLVDERTAELASTNARLEREIGERTSAQDELIALQRRLVETARAAGMAEIATGVLHNVGNLLNSVNVSVEMLRERMQSSRLPALNQAIELLQDHVGSLDLFLTEDERGQQILPFLRRLAERLDRDRAGDLAEIDALQRHLGNIDVIVRKQQQYAKAPSAIDTCPVDELIGDALALARASLDRNDITVVIEGEAPPPVVVDRHKALQILANLLSNAEQALSETRRPDKRITISTSLGERGQVRIRVADNGVGIAPEHLGKLFTHGFTTRPGGHGFGLHNSYLAARSMHGMLHAHSDGPGRGATFDLELPAQTSAAQHEPLDASAREELAR